MKLQFSIAWLMLGMAFLSIWIGGVVAFLQASISRFQPLSAFVGFIAAASPTWIPVAFVGYALGRRDLTVRIVAGFAVAEAMSVAVMFWVWEFI